MNTLPKGYQAALLFCGLGLPDLAAAQTPAPTTWRIEIQQSRAGTYSLQPPADLSPTGPNYANEQKALTIELFRQNSAPTIDCSAFVVEWEVPGTNSLFQLRRVGNPTAAQAQFQLPASSLARLRHPGTSTARLLVRATPAGAALAVYRIQHDVSAGNGASRYAPTTNISSETCATAEPRPANSRLYDEPHNKALFIVTPTGNVLFRPAAPIDENDHISVKVVGLQDDITGLQIRRSSAIRQQGTYYVQGEIPNPSFSNSHAGECDSVKVELADFAPGQGAVEMSRIVDDKKVVVGTFDFTVNRLYRGAFSFGPVYSWLTDRSFGTVRSGNDTIVTVTAQSPRLRYMVAYTHYFHQGGVDTEKRSTAFLANVAPTIGLSLTDPLKNLFLGLSYNIAASNTYLTIGGHVSEVTVLDPAAKLGIGDKMPRNLTIVPTRTQLGADWFVSVSIDLRAASKFFTALTSAATNVPH